MSVNSVRNIAMSFVPEADRKIYNFMFRAELSEKVNIALLIIFFMGVGSWLIEKATNLIGVLKTDIASLWAYGILFLAAFFLRKTHKRFYSIAMRISIPIFVVKYKMQEKK